MDRTPAYLGPRFGVETSVNDRFQGAIYGIDGKPIKLCDKRSPSYGEAFLEAEKMSKSYG